MVKNISEVCRDYYTKHRMGNNTIYTDKYGKTVIEETPLATVVYNHKNNMADIYCNNCGNWIGSANCSANSFWSFVHDIVRRHEDCPHASYKSLGIT